MSKQTYGRVTIHDVAHRAGVSASTVSLVLNGRRERMREDTFLRVMQVVEELGYATNHMARALKTGFVPTIGLIVPTVANPFWGEFARCVERSAMARNCQVMLCNGERDPERERWYAESMLARGIRGIIIGSAPLSLDHLVGLAKRGLHIITFDRDAQGGDFKEFDSVRVDSALGAQLAVQHLLGLGHRRIGFVSGPISSASRMDRLSAYRETLRQAGIAADSSLIWLENASAGSGEESGLEIGRAAAMALLQRTNPPTAFFAINDNTAFGLYAGAQELGLTIPADLSVVGFDDISLCRVVSPPLTTVRQPLEELMHTAVELLVSRLEQTNLGEPQHIVVAPSLVQRGSCAPPRALASSERSAEPLSTGIEKRAISTAIGDFLD